MAELNEESPDIRIFLVVELMVEPVETRYLPTSVRTSA
jgi:hypothetical protein